MYFAIGPWELNDKGWTPPAGGKFVLDLRSVAANNPTTTSGNYGCFLFEDSPNEDYRIISNNIDDTLTEDSKNILESIFNYRPTENNFHTALYECMTEGADPTGGICPKPIMPNNLRRQSLYINNQQVINKKFNLTDSMGKDNVIEVIKQDLETNKNLVLEGSQEENVHRKLLAVWKDNLRLKDDSINLILPNSWDENDTPITPTTTFTDDFNRSDSPTLGSNWTSFYGNLEVSSNSVIGIGYSRYNLTFSSSNHYSQLTTISSSGHLFVRINPNTTNTDNLTAYNVDLSRTNSYLLLKYVEGFFTALGSGSDWGVPAKLEIDGSNLNLYKNGVLHDTVTDTSITGYLKAGIGMNGAGTLDDWEGEDLETIEGQPAFGRGQYIPGMLKKGTLSRLPWRR